MRPCLIKNLRWKKNVLVGDVVTSEGGFFNAIPVRSTVPLIEFSPDPVSNYEGICEVYEDGYVYALLTFPVIDSKKDVRPGEARFRSFTGDEIVVGNRFIHFLTGPVSIEISGIDGKIRALTKDFSMESSSGEIEFANRELEIKVIDSPQSGQTVAKLDIKGGPSPSIDLDVSPNTELKMNRAEVEVRLGDTHLKIRADKNIELKNPQASLQIRPNGEVQLGQRPAYLKILPSGKVEIHAPQGISFVGPFVGNKVLTSSTVICPILGPLSAMGEPMLKAESG